MSESKYYLYRHIRPDTNTPFYVGVGNMKSRRAWETRRRSEYWTNIVKKNNDLYSVDILIENLTKENAEIKEIEFIALYGRKINDTGCLSNIQPGGKIHTGYSLSQSQKEKLRIYSTGNQYAVGYKHTESSKASMRITRKGRLGPNKGRSFSDVTRSNMSVSHLGNISNTGKIWINNGIDKRTFILKDQTIPEGWTTGKKIINPLS